MVRLTEIDGVPTVLGPTTGPMHAGLVFRVGQADERLARRGITHLVEHLALHNIGVADYHYNGATTPEFTYFHTQGTAADIVPFLTGVCAALRELPMHRLETEKEILRTEQSGRGGALGESMAVWRYGARDYGLHGYPEWGLPAIGPEELRAWVAHFFTRGNAALWIAGDEVPAGLRLDLLDGPRRPAPAPSSALPKTPAYFRGDAGAVVWDSVVPRSALSGVFLGVLERAMMRSLRQEQGLSYSVTTDYDARADGTALVTAAADALPEKRGAVLGGFVDVLAALRFGRVEENDVRAVVARRCDELTRAEEQGARLPGQAFALLTGRPLESQSLERVLAETQAVTARQVAEVAAAAWENGLLMTPGGRDADWTGLTAAPSVSPHLVGGTQHRSLENPDVRLIVGPEGVAIVDSDGDGTSVRYDSAAVVLAWPDGGRLFIGTDAFTVRIEPTMFHDAARAIPWLDQHIPPGVRVDQPPRDPEKIPRPEAPATRPGTVAPPKSATGRIVALVLAIPLTLALVLLDIIVVVALASGEETGALVVTLIVCLLATLAAALAIRWGARGLRAYRSARA
ncbi:insulinase family protein [Actinoplanes sp. NPDC051633]|uniref:insulinase family protein n=1 Tax=Actinoplanes sp. NPDC051633 TaxID=3155670 RepID=UPI00342AD805